MQKPTAANMQEALAIIGLGLFAFGVWQIYPPAFYLYSGVMLMMPFARQIKRGGN